MGDVDVIINAERVANSTQLLHIAKSHEQGKIKDKVYYTITT